jgi:3-keto-disaccharide hydrolase
VPRNAFLVTDKKYSDFILKGSVRLSPEGGNSGVQVRSAVISDGMLGYQFDMGVPWWGQLYVESSMRGILAPVDDRMKRYHLIHTNDWNQFVIICKGNHLIGELNGEITFDFVDYYGDKTGSIGLQIHAGAPMTVAFKNLEINELH